MSRNVMGAIILVLTAVFGAWAWSSMRNWVLDRPAELYCSDFLKAPKAGWYKLRDCALDVDSMVLISSNGEFEPLDNRRKGISSRLYEGTPKWVAALIPMTSPMERGGARRAALRTESADLMKWVNTHEVADELKREKMWQDPAVLRRMTKPAILLGEATKPEGDETPRAFGPTASVNMHVFTVGEPPERMHVGITISIGFVFYLLAVVVLIRFTRSPRQEHELTPEQVTARNIVGSTDVQLGELEQIRAEERARERAKKRGG